MFKNKNHHHHLLLLLLLLSFTANVLPSPAPAILENRAVNCNLVTDVLAVLKFLDLRRRLFAAHISIFQPPYRRPIPSLLLLCTSTVDFNPYAKC
jgi:hypothetical protein